MTRRDDHDGGWLMADRWLTSNCTVEAGCSLYWLMLADKNKRWYSYYCAM